MLPNIRLCKVVGRMADECVKHLERSGERVIKALC